MKREAPPLQAELPDSRGLNLYTVDPSYKALLALYLPPELHAHLQPHFERLGLLAGGELDALAQAADGNPPVLQHRTRRGEDRQWIDKHPAYRQLESVAFAEYGLPRCRTVPGCSVGRRRCRRRSNMPSPTSTCRPSSACAARCR
jgi:hypothetical protein